MKELSKQDYKALYFAVLELEAINHDCYLKASDIEKTYLDIQIRKLDSLSSKLLLHCLD